MSDLSIENILSNLQSYAPMADLDLVRRAYDYAKVAHRVQQDINLSPLAHSLAVADLVAQLRMDDKSIAAAILHDVREDSPNRVTELEHVFGREVAELVDGVTKLSTYRFTAKTGDQAENFKRMLIAMSRDIRVLLVKLCDRLQTMRDLAALSETLSLELSEETLSIYSPLAERLGITWVRTELEDLAFRYLWPKEYEDLKKRAEERLKERAGFIREVIETITSVLQRAGLRGFEVYGRPKNLYGIFRKMKIQGIDLDKVYDFVAFRVIVREVGDCWIVLGHLHNLWTPIPHRFKDYINMPKPNGYRSLHTSVYGPLNEPMEIQIRTREMHRVAEAGIAAHWTYKEGKVPDQERFAYLRQLIEWAKEVRKPQQLFEGAREGMFADRVFVFTPTGELRVLPMGATALDFAYEIHTEVGHRCNGARINGRLVPLSTQLRSGDMVEITTSKSGRPKRDWLTFVVTSRAKSKIRQYFQQQARAEEVEAGKQALEKELRRRGLSLRRVFDGGETEQKTLKQLHFEDKEEVFRAVANEKIKPSEVVEATGIAPLSQTYREPGRLKEVLKRRSEGIAVDGLEGVLLHLGKCCNPIPGDQIVAFVTRGRGVTVHLRTCDMVKRSNPDRLLEAHWLSGQMGTFDVPIQVICKDEPGVLARLTKEIAERRANISSILTRPLGDGNTEVKLVLQVEDQSKLDSIIKSIRRARGVLAVFRMRQPSGL